MFIYVYENMKMKKICNSLYSFDYYFLKDYIYLLFLILNRYNFNRYK